MAAADEARARVREGRARFEAGEMAAARVAFEAAERLFPNEPAVLHALGRVRMELGDDAGAEAMLRRALAAAAVANPPLVPQIEAHLGQALLFQERWAEGFQRLDRWRDIPRWRGHAAPDLPIPRWEGGPVEGRRLLIGSEEGLGDQIMYARFAAVLAAQGAEVTWAAPPPLERMFREGLDVEVLAASDEAVRADLYVTSSALPVRLMPKLADPPPGPYLRLPEVDAPPGPRIGVMAKGNPQHWNDHNRSLDDAAAAELMALPGAVSLAPEATGADDFLDTARVIAGLELVITVDTSLAHLAGALGKPVWILLPAVGLDWRWGRGERTPWYSSARLFRQSAPRDWRPVLNAVKRALG